MSKLERNLGNATWRKSRMFRPVTMYHHKIVPEHLRIQVHMADRWKYHLHTRISKYYDFAYTELWYIEQERLRQLLRELQSVNIFVDRSLKSSLMLMVNLVDIASNFYDAGLINVSPDDKADAVDEFNGNLEVLACREKTYHGFLNQAPKGGKVTLDNLYLAISDRITAKEASKFPKPLVKEYEGEFFLTLVPYKPLKDWATKKQKSIFNGPLIFNIEKFVQTTINVKSILQKNIEDLLK